MSGCKHPNMREQASSSGTLLVCTCGYSRRVAIAPKTDNTKQTKH